MSSIFWFFNFFSSLFFHYLFLRKFIRRAYSPWILYFPTNLNFYIHGITVSSRHPHKPQLSIINWKVARRRSVVMRLQCALWRRVNGKLFRPSRMLPWELQQDAFLWLLGIIYMRNRSFLPYLRIIICLSSSTWLGISVWVILTFVWWTAPPPGSVRKDMYDLRSERERETEASNDTRSSVPK